MMRGVRVTLSRLRGALPYLAAAVAMEHYLGGAINEMLTTRPEIVDFGVYFRAAQALAAGHSIYPPFSGCCFDPAAMDGYTYPPVLAVVLRPLAGLPVGTAGRIFFGASQLCLLAALVVMHITVRSMVSRRTEAWLLAAVLLFQPIHAGNFGLQVSNLLLLLFALAAWSYVHQRGGALGGVAIGLGTALKVAPAQMMAALFIDRRRRAVISTVGFGIAAALPLLLVWPLVSETPSYFTTVLPRFAGGVSAPWNRSFAGVILRTYAVTGHVPPQVWATGFHLLQIGGVVCTWVLCRRCASTPAGRAATFAAFLAVMPITQPVTWDHHMASDALAFVLIAPTLRQTSPALWAAVAGMALMCVNQLELTAMLQRAGFDPPHGAGTIVFVAGASVNLVGMALLYGATLGAARMQRTASATLTLPGRRRALIGAPQHRTDPHPALSANQTSSPQPSL